MVDLLFYLFAAIALMGGLLSIMQKEPVHCALWLVLTLFSVAVLYLLMNAEFLFAVQIFIYAGGIMVLYLFVIFLVEPARSEMATAEPRMHRVLAPGIVLIFSPVLIFLLVGMPIAPRKAVTVAESGPLTVEEALTLGPRDVVDPKLRTRELAPGTATAAEAAAEVPGVRPRHTGGFGNTKAFGLHLFTRYLFAFEIVSVVLLVAMLGAIVMGRKRFSSYTPQEEALMLAEAHYQGSRLAPPTGTPEQILREMRSDEAKRDKQPGSDFKVFPEYEG